MEKQALEQLWNDIKMMATKEVPLEELLQFHSRITRERAVQM